jgi:hypothetical protein
MSDEHFEEKKPEEKPEEGITETVPVVPADDIGGGEPEPGH